MGSRYMFFKCLPALPSLLEVVSVFELPLDVFLWTLSSAFHNFEGWKYYMRENRGQKKLLWKLLVNNSLSLCIAMQTKVAYVIFEIQLVATKSN